MMKVNALDVAQYILSQKGPMTAMKLQKLVYYSQAWSLVWDEKPLFGNQIQAWANGPVCPELYIAHRGQFEVRTIKGGNPKKLDQRQRVTVDSILNFYGDKTSQWLSDLTHQEYPWANSRQGIPVGTRGNREITHAAMAEYYGSL